MRDVSLEVPPGEVTALLGPNGAGKSSMVLAIGGVLPLEVAGTVMLDERELAGRRPERIRARRSRDRARGPPAARRDLTVEDNLRVATYSLSASKAEAGRARALELFPELEKRLGDPARSLSGGEQQMVVLAQALVSAAAVRDHRRAVARARAGRRATADPDDPQRSPSRGSGVLLIEQFATARARPRQPRLRDGGRPDPVLGRRRSELRENPELLHSAYLLRGRDERRTRSPPSRPRAGDMSVTELEHVLVLSDDIERDARLLRARCSASRRRAPAARVPRLLAVRRRRRPACTSPTAPHTRAHAPTLGLSVPETPQPGRARSTTSRSRPATTTSRRAARLADRGIAPIRNDVPGRPATAVLRRPERGAGRDQRQGSHDQGRYR